MMDALVMGANHVRSESSCAEKHEKVPEHVVAAVLRDHLGFRQVDRHLNQQNCEHHDIIWLDAQDVAVDEQSEKGCHANVAQGRLLEAALKHARIASILHNAECLSWKSSLAMLSQANPAAHLPTMVCESAGDVEVWLRWKFTVCPMSDAIFADGNMWSMSHGATGARVWIVKDALANGGHGLWICSQQNWRVNSQKILQYETRCRISHLGSTEFVIQRYVTKPDLWNNTHKYHYRVYAAIFGDGRLLVHPHAFAHVANVAYEESEDCATGEQGTARDFAVEMHITNVAANINTVQPGAHASSNLDGFHGFPTVCLAEDKPNVWRHIRSSLMHVCGAARPFMSQQRSANHFCYIGADFLVDNSGVPWLLELNVPPCLSAQSGCDQYVDSVTDVFSQHIYQLFVTILSSLEPDGQGLHAAQSNVDDPCDTASVENSNRTLDAGDTADGQTHAQGTPHQKLLWDVQSRPACLRRGCRTCRWQTVLHGSDTERRGTRSAANGGVLRDNTIAWQSFRAATLEEYRTQLRKIADSWKRYRLACARQGAHYGSQEARSGTQGAQRGTKEAQCGTQGAWSGTQGAQLGTQGAQRGTKEAQSDTPAQRTEGRAPKRTATHLDDTLPDPSSSGCASGVADMLRGERSAEARGVRMYTHAQWHRTIAFAPASASAQQDHV
eukprot:m.248746 g.248746  ORF g.248746 m.248746 type:complete len:670 (-) comp19508_c0_seq3:265-2274(-)